MAVVAAIICKHTAAVVVVMNLMQNAMLCHTVFSDVETREESETAGRFCLSEALPRESQIVEQADWQPSERESIIQNSVTETQCHNQANEKMKSLA